MKSFATRLLIACALLSFVASGDVAQAGDLGDFFKKLGNSITKPRPRHVERQPVRKKTMRPSTRVKNTASHQQPPPQKVPPADPGIQQPEAPSVELPTPPPIQQLPIRVASSIPPAAGSRRDIPFGIPVPNKAGFVTSPYAPNQGFVDVRGFPSGTEVKDPYTNKIFLTP
ncbi:MAG: hypothetical protein M3505_08090 [Verrucomicrobiota bacterium]|nr:hypothetical protein [Chthoniobacterales bacterium]MBA3763257.1 hypothetical protein [Chthoniobacterales bacterium]MDQ3314574.1 hypothetical protein [Verrucomicrobiota bacterium]